MTAYAPTHDSPQLQTDFNPRSLEDIIQKLSLLKINGPILTCQVELKTQLLQLRHLNNFNAHIKRPLEIMLIEGMAKSCEILHQIMIEKDIDIPLSEKEQLPEFTTLPNMSYYNLRNIEYNLERTYVFAVIVNDYFSEYLQLSHKGYLCQPKDFYEQLCEQTEIFYTMALHFITPKARAKIWTPLLNYLGDIYKQQK